ncbi:FecR family protein [Gelidibacter salicanalis]|uniref:FecR family protein n=1 Tax=Gelidibacter salicanalis TaxID=291193 RepID=A0A934KWZ5_9FLAO|nr:FecR family protein [Gelidibacter salicanalis]MBJ7881858.1 FecR family protein [Gelidibacter salicanalis]
MNINNKRKFLILIEQLLSGKANMKEIKALLNFFQSHQEINTWENQDEDRGVVEEKIYNNIQKKLGIGSFKRKKVLSVFNANLLKYAAVILIGGFIAYSVLNRDVPSGTKDLKVVENNIQIGTNKATLTLENGSIVLLEKGTLYESQNISSNGDEIVYNAVDSQSVVTNNVIQYNYLTIPRGGQFVVKLSDNTTVWLNSESQLKYPINFIEGTSRKVELVYGEAYFEVSPSSLHNGDVFQVFSRGQKVEVVGTQFNVKAYKDEATIYTTLVEGKVLVLHSDNSQTLQPDQQYAYNVLDNTAQISNVNVYNEVSWRDGVFSFEDKSLKEIMTVLSRWYNMNVEFKNKDIENVEFVGVLYKDRSIESILKNIKSVGSIKSYEISDRNVILK